MALASLEDVKRVLKIDAADVDAARDARLRASLAAVESWAGRRLTRLTTSGPQVETYFDVYEDATLRLPGNDILVTMVSVFEYPSSSGIPLSPIALGLGTGYEITDRGDLILRPSLGVSPFEGAVAQRRLRAYSKVDVHYIGNGVVPSDVVEGVAYLAAGHYTDGDLVFAGIKSEKIGDYSYTLADADASTGEAQYVTRARFFLSDFFRQGRVSVT